MARRKWLFLEEWLEPSATDPAGLGPQYVVTVVEPGDPFAVAVEFRLDVSGGPFVIGLAVRRHSAGGYRGERTHLSPREMQRLPIASKVRAATAHADANWLKGAYGKVNVRLEDPPPEPKRRSSTKPSMKWLVRRYDECVNAGKSPAQVIAAEKDVPPNRVYGWIHEAKKTPRPYGLGPRT